MKTLSTLVVVLALIAVALAAPGCKKKSKDDPVIIPAVADFSASPLSGDAPLVVSFTDLSAGTITAWAWDFDNDGTVNATTQNPTHLYDTPGAYTVELTVTRTDGDHSETKTGYITVTEPAPNWALLDDPLRPDALGTTDIQGDDNLSVGDYVDWSEMLGTYDAYYVYFRVMVWDTQLDSTGDYTYAISVDMNESATFDAGDYMFAWEALAGFEVGDHEFNLLDVGAHCRVHLDGGLEFAIPRRLFDETGFNAGAFIVEDTTSTTGDVMPLGLSEPFVFQ